MHRKKGNETYKLKHAGDQLITGENNREVNYVTKGLEHISLIKKTDDIVNSMVIELTGKKNEPVLH